MRQIRRDVEFMVQSRDGLHWNWLAWLKTASGEPLQGTVNGNEVAAVKVAMAAIDEALADQAARAAESRAAASVIFAPAPPLSAGVPAKARKVLVAEDETLFREAAAASLEARGFEVFDAAGGEEALAILTAHPDISLLVADVRMPGMDGYTLVERGLAIRPNLKVLLMTGYASAPTRLVAAEGIATLRKPFDVELLCRRAEALAGAQASGA